MDRNCRRSLRKHAAMIIEKNFEGTISGAKVSNSYSEIRVVSSDDTFSHRSESVHGLPAMEYKSPCICEYDDSFLFYGSNASAESSDDILTEASLFNSDICLNNSVSSIKDKLAVWATKFNPSRESVNFLLTILREDYPFLPKDKRTLCETPRNSIIREMDNGSYLHIGLESVLSQFMLNNNFHRDDGIVYIDLNIDGIPISNSSSSTLWPILISVVNYDEVLCVGSFYGSEKPKNINNYLKNFVEDFIKIRQYGIKFRAKSYTIQIRAIIADAPARAFLLNIRMHSGYSCCHKCRIRGKYRLNRVTFPDISSALRTDTDFRNKSDRDHHLDQNSTIIEKLPIDCIKNVVIDYMHAVLEGAMKQLLTQWLLVRKKSYSMRKSNIQQLSSKIIDISSQLPFEFCRTPRPLHYLRRYKATEFRQLLLYTLPILLVDVVEESVYNHFLKLHCSIRILCSKNLHLTYNNLAAQFIKSFVIEFDEIYEDHQFSFNIHSLTHLCDDVLYFRVPLDNISSFRFENFLQSFKRLIKSGNCPLQQISNRYAEKMFHPITIKNKKDEDFPKNFDGSYKYLIINNYKYSNKPPNNYCFSYEKNAFIKINSIVKSTALIIHGQKVLETFAIYTEPIDSRRLGMHNCSEIILGEPDIFILDAEIVKVVHFSSNNIHYFLTFIH